MNKTTANGRAASGAGVRIKPITFLQKSVTACLALLAVGLLASTAQAQFVRFKSGQIRLTIPVNSTNTSILTNLVSLSGITGGAALSVTGLPTGADAQLSVNPAPTNNTPLIITVNTTNVAEGVYTFSLNGNATDTNGVTRTNNFLYTLQVGYLWNGGTNVAVNGTGPLNASSNWVGGVVPGVGDDIIFSDLGGQTNSVINSNLTANIVVAGNMTNGSVRFSQTNSAKYYTVQINPGVTWSLTGTNGFSMLRDYVNNTQALSQGQTVTMFGAGGTFVVSNELATFSMLIDNGIAHILDMAFLDNFRGDVNQISLGDYYQYPNFFNLETNNYGGIPRQFLCSINFAKTNNVKAVYADPFNYTNSDRRQYSLSFLNSELSGSSTAPIINFGISNLFNVDSVDFVGGNSRGNVQFNPALRVTTNIVSGTTNLTTNTMSAYFRGVNGGRMAVFSVADGGGTNTANSNIKTTVDFSTQGGVLNVLADRLFIGRDRQLIVTNGTPNYQGFMTMGNGLVDVNTAVFGYREHYQTNTTPPTFPTVPAFNGYCEGKFTINSNGTLKVNQTLTLGYTVADLAVQQGSGGNTEYGQVIVQNNGTLIAGTIAVGGPVYGASKNNLMSFSAGSALVISNTIGSAQQSLDSLTFNNNCTLTMNLDGANPGPYIYTTNLTTTGSNAIVIASIKNLASITGTIQLIAYSAGGGAFQGISLPAGLGGALLTTNNVGIYLTILTNTPKTIVWRGYSSSDWDLTTPNWLDVSTGLHTNFSSGDAVIFDDDGATPTTVNLAGGIDIIPGAVAMTNNANFYTINDGGAVIKGSATFAKYGTNGLQINAITSLTVQVNQGDLSGTGAAGSAVIAAGATMNFGGGIVNGITTSGISTFSGTGSGNIVVGTNGILTNAGTFNGSFSLQKGGLLYNTGSIGTGDPASYNAVGNPTVATNTTLINAGDIHALSLTINGTFEDLGTGTIYMNGDIPKGARGLTIALGGLFIPGGDGIGTTVINRDQPNPNDYPGRLLFSTGSSNYFKVDNGTSANTQVQTLVMGWGPNQSTPAINGGTLVITNVGVTPFTAGQTLTLVQYPGGGDFFNASTNTTNSYPIILPAAPGPGLAWDVSSIILHGTLRVISVPTVPTAFQFLTSYTNIVVTNSTGTPTGTNHGLISELKWPAEYIGWKLQSQSSVLTNTLIPTNWVTIPGSSFTNDVILTNIITTNGAAVFYRMTYP